MGKSSAALTDDSGTGSGSTTCSACNDNACVPTARPASASGWGDPHLMTFDNLRYDFQGVGEFIGVTDSSDPSFVVQLRFAAYGPAVSVARTVAARVNTDRVNVELWPSREVRINGVATPLGVDETVRLPGGGSVTRLPSAAGEGEVTKIAWPTGEVLRTVFPMQFSLTLHPSRPRTLTGLLGSADGNPANDLATRTGEAVAQPPTFSGLYTTFGNSWRITDSESLFDYEPGKNTATYTDLLFPPAPPVITAAQRAAATTACQAAGGMDQVTFEACVTDVATTGDTTLATAAAANVPPLQAGLVDVPTSSGVTYRIEQGQPGTPATIGCADGQREGLNDLVRFPHVAACLGSWTDAKSLRAPPTGVACGDDNGPCAVPADLCAPGWHVCGVTGDPAELHRLTALECEQAGGGSYASALSYCASKSAACTYAASQKDPYGCMAGGACSEPVCCGAACNSYGSCVDGVWPGKTHIIPDENACGAAYARTAGGVLCCDAATTTTCDGATVDDGNPCTRDSCDAFAGVQHQPIPGQSCSDGNACNGLEVCDSSGLCKAGVAALVDDGNPCTTDVCDPTSGVSHTPSPGAACSDGNVCNGSETCSAAGICRPGTPLVIDDADACTTDGCNPLTGVTHTPIAIDDGNPCTVDACDKTVGVTHTKVAAGTSCSDGNACNGGETCDGSGACQLGVAVAVDDGNPCTNDVCDASTGSVSHTPAPAGTQCPNANACDGVEVCNGSGACGPGAPPVLDDHNPCTADSCDPATGIHHTPFGGCVSDTPAIVAGGTHSCQLKSDGTVVCWGNNANGQSTPPAGEVFVQLAAGQSHTCGLRAAGSVKCWGSNAWGQLNVPATEAYVQISAGNEETCGVRTDGTVKCYGYGSGSVPPSSELYSTVSGGDARNCGLKPDGTPVCWNLAGAPTTGTYSQLSLSSFSSTACALRTDGVAVCWGNNGSGQATPPSGVSFTQLSTSQNVTCGITTTGAVRCWGYAGDGQLAVPTGTFTRVSVGNLHVCAVRSDGTIACWGSNASGQAPAVITPINLVNGTVDVAYSYAMSFGPPYSSTTPVYTVSSGSMPAGLTLASTGVLSGTPTTAGTYSFTVSYSDGTGFVASQLYTITIRSLLADGQACQGASQCASGKCVSELCCSGSECTSIAAGGTHSCELKPDGTVLCWGDNSNGQSTPPAGEVFVQLTAGQFHTCGLRAAGTVKCWGSNAWGQLNVPATETYVQVTAGNQETCGVRTDGTVKCYGYGSGSVPPSSELYSTVTAGDARNCGLKPDGTPVCWNLAGAPTTGTYSQLSLSSSAWTACALRSDGVAVCWGNNASGQATPPSGVSFTQLSTSQNVTCGITTTGAVRCWGYAANGQLAVPTGTFTRVSVGNLHACAVRSDGTIACWGSNASGQAPAVITPINLVSGTVDVAYSYAMSFGPPYSSTTAAYAASAGALPPGLTLSSGGVLSGIPTTAGTYSFTVSYSDGTGFVASQPYAITIRSLLANGQACQGASQCASGKCVSELCCSGSECTSIAAGGTHSCELKPDGTVLCWGDNSNGQSTPPAGEVFVQLTAGQFHTCGLRAAGTVKCWGSNAWGQLNVPASETYVQVTAGNQETCGVRTDGTVKCYGYGSGNVPPSSELYSTVSAGDARNCGLKPDGTPVCWNLAGAPTTGTYSQLSLSSLSSTACALRSDGVAVCWGNNGSGQATPPSGVTFTQLSTSQLVTCGITTAGTVRCWGYAANGQLAVPTGTFTRVSVGNLHVCAVRSDATIACWGSNANGQAPAVINPINLLNGTVDVAYSYAMSFGPPYSSTTAVYSVSSGAPPTGLTLASTGELSGTPTTAGTYTFTVSYSDGTGFTASQPYTITIRELLADGQSCTAGTQCTSGQCRGQICCSGSECTSIASGGTHTCELKADGTVVCWGNNSSGQSTPPAGEVFVQLTAGQFHTCGLRAAGTVKCWGSNGWGQLNVPATEAYVQISAGNEETCGVRTNGTVKCYGYGSGNVPPSSELYSTVSAGDARNCGLKPDGTPVCWNLAGAPPTGTYSQLSLSSLSSTACALRTDGVAVCWGNNGSGQATPPSGVTFTQLSTSQNVTCGITTAGAVVCWGHSGSGQLGVPSGTFTRVAVGNVHVCAVRSDGVVVCWGSNTSGQTTVPG